jgi:hypothetical protein
MKWRRRASQYFGTVRHDAMQMHKGSGRKMCCRSWAVQASCHAWKLHNSRHILRLLSYYKSIRQSPSWVTQLVKKFLIFIEHESSLVDLGKQAAGFYPNPCESCSRPNTLFLWDTLSHYPHTYSFGSLKKSWPQSQDLRFRLALSNGLNRVGVSHPTPEDGNRSRFRYVVFSTFRMPDDGRSPKSQ